MQINTENFQIIYPAALENEAQRMANTLEYIRRRVSRSLEKGPAKISIFLQNQGTTANGFVTLSPRRSEFFAIPPQEFDYQDWLNSLAVHELRHVVQFDKLSGKFKPPFEGLGLALLGITLPPWFTEGDAVNIETALTPAGRGRQPQWDLAFRTNTLSHKKYSYSKDFFGSLKDITPGYYQLGYYMTAKLRRDYGMDILDGIYQHIAALPVRPYNFSNSIKKLTGLNTRQLHDSTVNELEKLWRNQLSKTAPKAYPSIQKRASNLPENYLLPTPLENGSNLLFLKQSRAETARLVMLDSLKNEHPVIKIGRQEEPHFNYAAGRVVWDEFRYDTRYQQRSFNVINSYDIRTKKYRQLTHRSRLFAPVLSPDGRTIIAVSVSYSNEISLVELDAETGKEIKKYKSPHNLMLQTPSFNPSGEKIVLSAVSQSGKTIVELDRKSETYTQLLPYQQQLLSRPVYAGSNIVFKAHYNGIDNLYRLDPRTSKIYQLTQSEFGAYNPQFDPISHTIYFNNYQLKGYDIASIPLHTSAGISIDSIRNTSIRYIEPLTEQEGGNNIFDSIPKKTYQAKRYREIKNLFYFHSLLPIAEENNDGDYNLGIKLQSDNKLGTLNFYSGYRFNNALKKSEYLGGFTYKRYYPIFDFSYVNQARLAYWHLSPENNVLETAEWREHNINAEVTVPFIFNRRNLIYQAGFKAGSSYTSRYGILNEPENFNRTVNFPMLYTVYLSRNTTQSARDLAPRWGQHISLSYRHLPFEPSISGQLLTFKSSFYFPGIALNHTMQASFNYQNSRGIYDLVNDIPHVNGWSYLKPIQKIENTLLLDYRFPLFYPDWEIGPLAYIKRFKGGFFADFQNITDKSHVPLKSFGAELRADMNLLRFYLPNFDIGGKIIFLNEKSGQSPIFEFMMSYNL